MKTFKSILFLGSVFTISLGFFACGEDPAPDPASVAPGLSFSSPDPTKQLVQVDRYEMIKFNFIATANKTTTKDLSYIKIVLTIKGGTTSETLIDSTDFPEKQTKKIEYNYTVPADAIYGDELIITVTVEDIAKQKTSKSFSFKITDASSLWHYNNVPMGAQDNALLGSYFSSETGSVWFKSSALSNKTKVDFIYFFNEGTGDGNSIAAPSSQQLTDNALSLIQGWTAAERNKTEFKVVYMTDADQFDRIRSADTVIAKYQGGSSVYYIPTITGGGAVSTTYFVFKTVKNKYGIAKVIDMTYDPVQTKSSIVLSVKVQK